MKKKYGLFKVLTVLLLFAIVATYFLKGRDGNNSYLAIGDVFLNYLQSFYYFFDTVLFILVVGGFYGFLNRVPAYKKIVTGLAKKLEGKEKLFIIISTIIFALVSSLTGFNILLLIFIPFMVSIILLLGYDKLVALSTTIGGAIVGLIGGIFVTFKDATNQYSVSFTTFDKLVGLKNHFVTIAPRIILLVIATALLIYYILNYIKKKENKEVSYQLTKNDSLFIEAKDRTGKKVKMNLETTKTWPLLLVVALLTILLVLGYMPWNSLFNIDCFDKFHTWLTDLKIGDYAVFTSLISSSFPAFGSFASLGNYMMIIFLIVLFSFVLMLIYRVKFEDAMDGFLYGVKKMIPATMISMLAYTLLVCCYNNGFVETIITNASDSFGDNVVIHSLITMLGSITNVDLYYTVAGVFSNITSSLTDKANLQVYSVMFGSLYGLIQIAGPTSILLIIGLSYTEVPYSTWLKYIWRFFIEVLIIILIALMIVSLL